MALQNRKLFHFLCICWIILSYLGIIIIKAKQNCKYCIWHFNNQGYNVFVTRKRKTEYNPFKFPFITLPSSDLYILSHPSIHKNPLPGGFLCLLGLFSFSQKGVAVNHGLEPWSSCFRSRPHPRKCKPGKSADFPGLLYIKILFRWW